ncbi:KEOPS complex subunit Cgi121 [Thermococcus sp.]
MKVLKTEKHTLCIAKIKIDNPNEVIPIIGGNLQILYAKCWEHVVFATLLALRAFERGTNHAKMVNGEILLRLAGTLQINEAIKEHGVRAGENFVVVYGDRCKEELMKLLNELKLKELPLGECKDENLKSLFEKAALVEVL